MSEFAWVTLATNDSYSLGALVLAHSLKQVGTKHQLVVLITPGVTNAMREKLIGVFNLVEEVNPLDSKDESNLRLLKRPELGITFTKLHCWRLVQYQKCVFLDADTLVLSNSDELFDREEFSAAPDIGWPDCFNSGVFVYKPSNETYLKLVDFALQKGSFDGGDQGLLNLYFSDWAHKDIAKHLPFIYNMCSTAVYSYLPAFKQYGKNAKIVHFIGPAKPWLQYFNTENLTVYPSPGLQHLEEILQKWWNIFCSLIHPSLSRDMSGLAGAFAQFTLGAKRSAGQDALENHLRRQAWEVGNIDYLGRDSFDHIWTKICESMSAPIQESVLQPSVDNKAEARAVEAIGDIPTADTVPEISCTAGTIPLPEEKISPIDVTSKPSVEPVAEPPITEAQPPVAEEPKPVEISTPIISKDELPKTQEVVETPKTDVSVVASQETSAEKTSETTIKQPSDAKEEPKVVSESASIPLQESPPTAPVSGIISDQPPKAVDVQTTQAVLVDTAKVDVSSKEVFEPTTQEPLRSELPKMEVVSAEVTPLKTEASSTETSNAEAIPTSLEVTSKSEVPVPEIISLSKQIEETTKAEAPATSPSDVKQTESPKSEATEPVMVGEIVSTIVTPPTPTDATKIDTPTTEDVPPAASPAIPLPTAAETTPITEPISLPQPVSSNESTITEKPKGGVEGSLEQKKEASIGDLVQEPQKQEDLISKALDTVTSKPIEVPVKEDTSIPKKEEQCLLEKKEECPFKTEDTKSEPIPSEVQPTEVIPDVKKEAVMEFVSKEEVKLEKGAPKSEVEPSKLEAQTPKLEAEPPKAEAPKSEVEAPKAETEPPKLETEAPKIETEAPKVEADTSKPSEPTEQKPEAAKGEGTEGVQEKPKKKVVKKVKKVPKTDPAAPKAEAAPSEEQPEAAAGETSTPTPPPRKTTTVKKVKAKKP